MKLYTGNLCCVAGTILMASSVLAAKPQPIPAWHDGEIVHFIVVNENVDGFDEDVPPMDDPENKGNLLDVAIPFYVFPNLDPEGPALLQDDVLHGVPGSIHYNPWWKVNLVFVTNGRDLTENPFTSEEEVLQAFNQGKVNIISLDALFLCQVVPGANR